MLNKNEIIIAINNSFNDARLYKEKNDVTSFWWRCNYSLSLLRALKEDFNDEEITCILDKLIITSALANDNEAFKNLDVVNLYYSLLKDIQELVNGKDVQADIKHNYETLNALEIKGQYDIDYNHIFSNAFNEYRTLTEDHYYIERDDEDFVECEISDIDKIAASINITLMYINYYYQHFVDKEDIDYQDITNLRSYIPRNIYKALSNMYEFINYIDEDGLTNLKNFITNIDIVSQYLDEINENEFEDAMDELYGNARHKKNNYDDINYELKSIKSTLNETKDTADQIKKDTSHIKSKIDEIHDIMFKLTDEIASYKSFVAPLLQNKEETSSDFEEILTNFQDQMIEKINANMKQCPACKPYSQYIDELKIVLGENCFNKLSEESIDFIVTAKTMYDNLSNIDGEFDYSGICLLLTKALERECKKRFFYSYKGYMQRRFGLDTSRYPLWCVETKGKGKNAFEVLIPDNAFTLGSMAFATGYQRLSADKSDLYLTMNDYCEDTLFINKDRKHIKDTLLKIGIEVDKVAQDFRNPAAHIDPMSKVQAKECFDYLINVQKLLQMILNECRF